MRAALRARLSLRDEPVFTSVLLGMFFTAIGLKLLAEGGTFAISPAYDWFEERLTESTAGLVLLAAGVVTLLAPLASKWCVNAGVALMLAVLSGTIARGFYLGSDLSLGTWFFGILVMPLSWRLMYRRWVG